MAAFYNMLTTIQSFQIGDGRFDMISRLPPEISTAIFGLLDPDSMHSCMQVSKTWYTLYRSDRLLRRNLKRKVRKRREQRRLLIHNLTTSPTDTWYKENLPTVSAQAQKGLVRKPKKARKSLTRHTSKARPLRL